MHGKAVKLDFEGDSRRNHTDFRSVRPDADQYNEEFFKNEQQRSESDYKEWAYKASQDPETEKFTESFEAIHEIKDIKFRPDDVKIPDPSKRFELDGRIQNKVFSDTGNLYLAFIVFALAGFFYLINRRENVNHKEDMDNILYNLTHMDEYEDNLIENTEERIKNITKNMRKDREYKDFVKKIEDDSKQSKSVRDKLVPQMRSFVSTSDIDGDSL